MQLSERFHRLAEEKGYDAATQATLLLLLLDAAADPEKSNWFMEELEKPPASKPVQEADDFFGRSLDAAMLDNSRIIKLAVQKFVRDESGKTITAEIFVLASDINNANLGLLRLNAPVDGVDVNGGVIGGWRVDFPDKDIMGLVICNSPRGPWLDTFVVLGPEHPHGCLQPRMDPMHEVPQHLGFALPNGKSKAVQFYLREPGR